MARTPKISVVIPVKNGAPWLDDCIRGIMEQTLYPDAEIIAIDSGSTDDSLSILRKYRLRLYSIPPGTFNHGLTRQYGAELSRGEYVVMTVQDAKPQTEFWLQQLLSGFWSAENVAGVCGSQAVAHKAENNPVEWFRPVNEPEKRIVRFASAQEFLSLPAYEKVRACSWDDVTAMYKRSVLQKHPFRNVRFSEDAVWAKDALMAGYTLVYNPAARVYHYHHEDEDLAFRRTLTVMYMRYKEFGHRYNKPARTLRQTASLLKTIFTAQPLSLSEKLDWVRYNHHQLKAQQKAFSVFEAALAKGEAELDAVHDFICSQPPQHQKKQHPVQKETVYPATKHTA